MTDIFQCFFFSSPLSIWTSGKELSATIENLRPATDYHVRSVLWFRCTMVSNYGQDF